MSWWLERLTKISKKKSRIVLGLMSGTSVDGVDVAICRITGAGISPKTNVELLHFSTFPYPNTMKSRISAPQTLTVRDVAELDILVADFFSSSAIAAIESAGMRLDSIDLVGSHGQTIYHHSRVRDTLRTTLQIGCGDVIAVRIKTAVFSDFRRRDIATGGEGAPLTPYADAVLFGSRMGSDKVSGVLNLGGVANITILSRDSSKILGFDTGPANAPLDRLAHKLSNGSKGFDRDGLLARSGSLNSNVLQKLLSEDKYISTPPPKSTGFEMYGDGWVDRLIELHGGLSEDVLRCAVEFVVQSIVRSVRSVSEKNPIGEIIIAGGGARNLFLIERLRVELKPIELILSDDAGIPSDAREAIAFALLANDALCGLPTSLPSVTGSRGAAILGKLSLPPSS